MEYTHLGRLGLQVSKLCLGTMNFGPQTSEKDSFAIMDKALDIGINFFDTANVYGGPEGRGVTETIVGKWLTQGGNRREDIVLATKVYGPMATKGEREEPNRDSGCLSAAKIVRACEASLRRLQTDCIDLYQMHHIDRHTPVDEIWSAMETLKQQGKIIYVGSSNFAGWDIATYNMAAQAHGRLGLVSEQSVYSLLNRTIELEVIPACRHYGLGVIPWSPLAGGALAGLMRTKASEGRRSQDRNQAKKKEIGDQLNAYESLCSEMGHEPAAVALAWLLSNPVVTAPIIGPRTMEQLTSSLDALKINLDETALKKLDELFPGPGGEAPKAYAW